LFPVFQTLVQLTKDLATTLKADELFECNRS
jgi:hypothetical protein